MVDDLYRCHDVPWSENLVYVCILCGMVIRPMGRLVLASITPNEPMNGAMTTNIIGPPFWITQNLGIPKTNSSCGPIHGQNVPLLSSGISEHADCRPRPSPSLKERKSTSRPQTKSRSRSSLRRTKNRCVWCLMVNPTLIEKCGPKRMWMMKNAHGRWDPTGASEFPALDGTLGRLWLIPPWGGTDDSGLHQKF